MLQRHHAVEDEFTMHVISNMFMHAAIDPIGNPLINEDLAMREVQTQQAIQDLEALLQPGALEARIQQVRVFFILQIVVCLNISKKSKN